MAEAKIAITRKPINRRGVLGWIGAIAAGTTALAASGAVSDLMDASDVPETPTKTNSRTSKFTGDGWYRIEFDGNTQTQRAYVKRDSKSDCKRMGRCFHFDAGHDRWWMFEDYIIADFIERVS